jgi:CMP-2-keto-3-deoxyoctulosonic acid synthetase
MVKTVEAARQAARKAIEATYDGVLTVTEHQKVKDEVTKVTGYKDVVVLTDQPCRLSFERLQTAIQSDSSASVAQTTKLFVSPDIVIKAGSKITVTQAGVTTDYTCSGIPAVYMTHQEIIINLFKSWT